MNLRTQTPGHVKYPGPAPFCPVFQPPHPRLAVPLSPGETVLNSRSCPGGTTYIPILFACHLSVPLGMVCASFSLFVQLQKWPPSQGEEHEHTESTLEAYHSETACLLHPPALTPAGTVLPSSIPGSTTQNLCPGSVQCELPRLSAALSVSLSLHGLFSLPGTLAQYPTPRLP